jgi:hypothetical protein
VIACDYVIACDVRVVEGFAVRCSFDRSCILVGKVVWLRGGVCGRSCVFCELCGGFFVQDTISVLWLCGGLVVKSCASLRKANELGVIRFLLEHRASVDNLTRDGKTPQDSTQRLALVVHR